jgi:hypothetical protein
MSTRIFIMAQGMQSRMTGLKFRKQLLHVGGQAILARTIGLVRSHWYMPVDAPTSMTMEPTVVGWPDFSTLVEQEYGCELLTLRYAGSCILDGMHGTDPHWSAHRNIFLLGDVVYSRAAMDTILSCDEDVMFFGTDDLNRATGELFAYTMAGAAVNTTAELLMRVGCRKLQLDRGQAGHLRNLLWIWMQFLGLKPSTLHEYAEELMTAISDWTNDIDTDADVRDLLPELDRHAWDERNTGLIDG